MNSSAKNEDTCDGDLKHWNDHIEQTSNKNNAREKENDFIEKMRNTKEKTEKKHDDDLQKQRNDWSNINCCTYYSRVHSGPFAFDGVNNST